MAPGSTITGRWGQHRIYFLKIAGRRAKGIFFMCCAKDDAVGPSRGIPTESTRINRGRGVFKANFQSQPEGPMQRLFIFLVGISVCLAFITPLRAQPGALDSMFDPKPNGLVSALAMQRDGQLILGGDFSQIGTTSRNRVARLNLDGSVDASFDSGSR